MQGKNVFAVLEIEPTNDKKEIKKAYARLVKKYHPEEYPEKWKEIHSAYEIALQLAEQEQSLNQNSNQNLNQNLNQNQNQNQNLNQNSDSGDDTIVVPVMKVDTTEQQPVEQQLSESQEMDVLFDNLNQFSSEQQQQNAEIQKKAVQAAIDEIKRISEKKKSNTREWEAFFGQNDILPVLCTRDFLYALGECFNNKKIDDAMYKLLKEQLGVIRKYIEDRNIKLQNIGISDPLGYAESKINTAFHANYEDKFWNRNKNMIWVVLGVIFVVIKIVARYAINDLEEQERATQQLQNEQFQEIIEQQSKKEELANMKQMFDEYDMWTKGRMIFFLNCYSDDMLQEAQEKEVVLNEGIALWNWREETSEEIVYEIHAMPVSEEIQEDYHIYAFCVTSESEQTDRALLCDLQKLGFSNNCSIYYYNGTEYVKIPRAFTGEEDLLSSNEIFSVDLAERRAFLIDTHICDVQNPYPIVLIEAVKDAESTDSSEEDEEMQEILESAIERRIEIDAVGILSSLSEEEQQSELENAVYLQDGIYISDMYVGVDEEKEKEEIVYTVHELPIYEQIQDDYHIYAFCVNTDEMQRNKVLWCDPKTLGFSGNYKIYYGNQTGFEAVDAGEILDYQILQIDTFAYSTEPMSIVMFVEEVVSDEFALTKEDFIISYDGINIDGDTSHTELFETLGCPESFDAYNGGYISNGNGYQRWNLCYPSYEEPEIQMIYLTDSEIDVTNSDYNGESYLIGISLVKMETARGLKVGDTTEKMISLYGEPDVLQPYGVTEILQEAIYYYGDYRLEIIFYDEVVQYILLDYRMDESIMKQFMGIDFSAIAENQYE